MRELRMQWPRLRRYVWLIPLLALTAGYLTGHRPVAAANADTGVPGSPLTLEHPARWRPASPPGALAAIGVAHAVILAPRGHATGGGLLAAAFSAQGAPLPAGLLAMLRGKPRAEVVWLVSSTAYRYGGLSIAGSDLRLTAYSIPAGGERFTLAICFAPPGQASIRHRCEAIVESSGAPEAAGPLPELQPQPHYASQLSAVLGNLQRLRSSARNTIAGTLPAARLASEAGRLASGYAAAQATLKTLSTPAVADRASAALAHSMLEAQLAYTALAAAAQRGELERFALARRRIETAEAESRDALLGFNLLGYRIA